MKYLQMVKLWYCQQQMGEIKSISINNSLLSDAEESYNSPITATMANKAYNDSVIIVNTPINL